MGNFPLQDGYHKNGVKFTHGEISKNKDSIFWLSNAFSSNLNTINLSIFSNHGGIYRFEREFNIYTGER